MAKVKKKGNPIIIGLIMLGGSLGALWKNEHRFDYHQAAVETAPVAEVAELTQDSLFSHSGEMDQKLTLKGPYVRSFQGYLEVRRNAEIYAWDRDEDDDGVDWTKKWMSHLQTNDRNEGLKKKLKSDLIRPKAYHVGELTIQPDDIQFVDDDEQIASASLKLTKRGGKQKLKVAEEYFYLSKGGELGDEELGDERLSYRGLPVPESATYFGKWGGERAIVHQAEIKEGFLSDIIGDKGILHHLAAGSRETALASIEADLKSRKMTVRGIGLAMATIGGGILFSSLTRFLVFVPFLGSFIHRITGWLGMLLGFLLGLLTLGLAFLTSQPLVLALLLLVLGGVLFYLSKNAKRKRQLIRDHLAQSLGHQPSQYELEELEYVKLHQLMASDGEVAAGEQKKLDQWTKRHRWSEEQAAAAIQKADEERAETSPRENLESLIRFSLADGRLDRREMKSIEGAAQHIGVSRLELTSLLTQVQRA